MALSIRMQKYAENCSFYVLKVQKFWHKIVTFSAPNILDPLPTLNMQLIIKNALLWDQKVLNWRDLEIIKGAGVVLRPTTVQCMASRQPQKIVQRLLTHPAFLPKHDFQSKSKERKGKQLFWTLHNLFFHWPNLPVKGTLFNKPNNKNLQRNYSLKKTRKFEKCRQWFNKWLLNWAMPNLDQIL